MARRVLIDALSSTVGGGRTYLLNLLRELDRDARGFEFTLLAAPGHLSPSATGRLDVETVALPGRGRASKLISRVAYEELALPFRARRFDLLYCLADLCPRFGATPTVVHLRNLNIYDHRFYDTWRLHFLERLVRFGIPHAKRVIFPSRAAADFISERVSIEKERVAVVPHGIASDAFVAGDEIIASDAPYLFLPSSIEKHKNLAVLVECLRHVRDPRLEAWIAGHDTTDPAYAADLYALVERLGLSERVRFLGLVPYREVFAYYRGAAALVFPSLLETFGHPMLEGMLAGTPVVAADLPVFREIGGEAASYFDPRDPIACAAAVDRATAHDPERERRIEVGRARAARFSWKDSIDRLCEVFDEVMRAG